MPVLVGDAAEAVASVYVTCGLRLRISVPVTWLGGLTETPVAAGLSGPLADASERAAGVSPDGR